MKRCTRCDKTLARAMFPRGSAAKDGLSYWCRQCHKAYDTERRKSGMCVRGHGQKRLGCTGCRDAAKKRRELRIAAGICPQHGATAYGKCPKCAAVKRAWYQAQRASGKCHVHADQPARGCQLCLSKAIERRLARWGYTPESYEAEVAAQGGGCKICGRPPGAKRLHVDHDHKTGVVRGLLCSQCNVTLGLMADSPERLFALAAYLDPKPEWIGAGC